jgi:glycosyltransferase involved in cell wall biosynthesis
LPRAISSVLGQTFSSWEIVVVDDGSTDDPQQFIQGVGDARIRLFRHERNMGPSAARNTGIRAALGTFVAFLDSDDEWLPGKLAADVRAFQTTPDDSVGMVYCGEGRLESGVPRQIEPAAIEGKCYEKLLAHDFVGSCSRVTVRKHALDTVGGFDESLVNEEDWDLWIRISKHSDIRCVRENLVIRHFGADQITGDSGSLQRIYEGRSRIIEKHRTNMSSSVLAMHMGMLAGLALNYDLRRGRSLALAALRLKFLQPRLLAALLVSLFGREAYRGAFALFARLRHGSYMGRSQG